MHDRPALAVKLPSALLAGAVILAVAPSASAAAAKPCQVIRDAAGDANETLGTGKPNPQPNDPSLDLLSLSSASDAKYVTLIFRVAALPNGEASEPLHGRAYEADFVIGESTAVAQARYGSGESRYQFGIATSANLAVLHDDGVTGTADSRHGLVTVRLEKRLLSGQSRAKLTDWQAVTSTFAGTVDYGSALPVDRAQARNSVTGMDLSGRCWP